MKQFLGALVLVCGLAAAQANAACDYPVAPGKFPDGTQATKEEMLAAKKLVVKYDADMTAYLTCIQSEFQTKVALLDKDKTTPEQKDEMTRMQDQKQNAAIDEVKAVTERFNEQLRAWKAKNVPEKKPS
jgi:hypothetical protein